MAGAFPTASVMEALVAPGAAFLSPSALPVQSQGVQTHQLQQRVGASSESSSPRLSTIAAASVFGAAALAAASKGSSRRAARVTREAKVARTVPIDEDPYAAYQTKLGFAGGLVGGSSAFSSFDYNFDPAGFSTKFPQWVPWFREAELKHGRCAMLGWVGLVVPDLFRLPVGEVPDTKCYEAANVVEAHNMCVQGIVSQGGPLFQVYLACWIVEFCTTLPKAAIYEEGITLENAGDYGLGKQFLPEDPAKAEEMRLKELKNGRLAMIAFGGAITQAVLSGNGFPWLYAEKKAASPGLASSVPMTRSSPSTGSSKIAMRAEPTPYGGPGGYKMSKAVPFLPVSPALEGMVGEEDGFDPMGFTLAFDNRWLREAELKHGRVAMLATVGWITTDLGFRVPGPMFQVSTIEAHDAMIKFGNMPQMLVWLGYAELFGFLAIINMMEYKTDRQPGDFGLRTLYPEDAAGQYDMQMKELRNGRLAMLAFSGIATASVLTQSTWPFFPTALATEQPVRKGSALCGGLQGAKSTNLVAAKALQRSASLPFMPKPKNLDGYIGEEQEFDPLCFAETFDIKWLREAELKHGRVSMLASVGFLAQQYVTFPGMTPVENALNSVVGASPGAVATLVFIVGYIESQAYGGKITMLDMFEGNDRVPGDFDFGSGFLKGKSDEEVKEMKLKELQNGRLAMFAIGGMVHHNLVVNGPLFPLFPDNWEGPQGTWDMPGFAGGVINNLAANSGL